MPVATNVTLLRLRRPWDTRSRGNYTKGCRIVKKEQRKVAIYLRSCAFNRAYIEIQRRELRKFCAQQDLAIAAVYEDNGFSGMTNNRPGLRTMLRAAVKGKFEAFVVRDLGRLTRSSPELLRIAHSLDRGGVSPSGTPLAIDTTMCYGKWVMAYLGAFGSIRRRLRALAANVEAGRGGSVPSAGPDPRRCARRGSTRRSGRSAR